MHTEDLVVRNAVDAIEMRNLLRSIFVRAPSEIISNTHTWMRRVYSEPYGEELDLSARTIHMMPRLLLASDLVLWDSELFEAATSGSGVFDGGCISSELLKPDGVNTRKEMWFLQNNHWYLSTEEQGVTVAFVMFVTNAARSAEGQPFPMLVIASIVFSATFSTPVLALAWISQDSQLRGAVTGLVAAMEFMRTPVAARVPILPPRQYRRVAKRHNELLPAVYTIKLRRQLQANQSTNRAHHNQYQCQWLVGAHWRNQYYPSNGRHKPVYILPYVKGDPSKPFKPPGGKVYAVVR